MATPIGSEIHSMINHEKLDVYRLSLDFLALLFPILERMPRGNAQISDQIRRAAIIGSTQYRGGQRQNFIARSETIFCYRARFGDGMLGSH